MIIFLNFFATYLYPFKIIYKLIVYVLFCGGPTGIRTLTVLGLNQLPLPVGLLGRITGQFTVMPRTPTSRLECPPGWI